MPSHDEKKPVQLWSYLVQVAMCTKWGKALRVGSLFRCAGQLAFKLTEAKTRQALRQERSPTSDDDRWQVVHSSGSVGGYSSRAAASSQPIQDALPPSHGSARSSTLPTLDVPALLMNYKNTDGLKSSMESRPGMKCSPALLMTIGSFYLLNNNPSSVVSGQVRQFSGRGRPLQAQQH